MGNSYWCRKHTGDSSYIWCEISCSQWANHLRRFVRFKYSAQNGGTYKPQPGDLIFFDWEGGSSGEDHIGIVVYSDSSKAHTIEGNTSDAAGLEDNGGGAYFKSYSLNYGYISRYGILPYTNVASVPDIDYSGANPTPGLYIATNGSKTVYTTETGTSSNYTMPRFNLFYVTGICSTAKNLLASSTSTYEQKKTCADELNALVTRKGEGALVKEGAYVTAFNKKIVAADCNIFTPSFGTVTADKANRKWTTNVVAKYDTAEGAYVIKSIVDCPGASVTDITLASDEILTTLHQDTTVSTSNSLKNYEYILGAKVGDILTFYGVDPKTASITCGAYFTYKSPYIPGDANGDKIISSTDYIQVKRHCNGSIVLAGTSLKSADYNGDGTVSAADFIAIRQVCARN